ncbi:MAG: glycoside hydrolase family 19 protein [Isosphaeraceae bacterium]
MSINLTVGQLRQIVPTTSEQRLNQIVGPLNDSMREFDIKTPNRIAAFLGNIIVESDHFKTFREYASGHEYEWRKELGNTHPGDGVRYKGRGVIQITGRHNYEAVGRALGVDLINHPGLLETNTSLAMRSGGWFWTSRNLNQYADLGAAGFADTVYRVNGAVTAQRTHWDLRVHYYKETLKALGAPVPSNVPTTYHHSHHHHHPGGAGAGGHTQPVLARTFPFGPWIRLVP